MACPVVRPKSSHPDRRTPLYRGVLIPTMPISRSSESRSFIPIDSHQCGVGTPLDAFLISVFSPDVKYG